MVGSFRRFSNGQRRWGRILVVIGAVLAAEVVWLVAELVFGVRLQAPAGSGYPQPVDIGPGTVAVASFVLSLLGWGVLAVLERFTSWARRIWLALSLIALVASLGMPMSGSGVPAVDRAVLVLMHVLVAAILVPAMYRTSPRSERQVRQSSPGLMREAA
jgi:hypothetical protein